MIGNLSSNHNNNDDDNSDVRCPIHSPLAPTVLADCDTNAGGARRCCTNRKSTSSTRTKKMSNKYQRSRVSQVSLISPLELVVADRVKSPCFPPNPKLKISRLDRERKILDFGQDKSTKTQTKTGDTPVRFTQ